MSFFYSACSDTYPSPRSLQYDDKKFNQLVRLIIQQKEVNSMDDFTRYYKSINGIAVKIDSKNGDQNAQLLNRVVDSLKIDYALVQKLRLQLEDTKLREFVKSGDSILFIVDGFLDDSWGFMYSRQPLKSDTSWFDFKDYIVKSVQTINNNWTKTAIR